MHEKSRKKREAPISYRPPAELREEFLARVENSGLTTCAYITRAVFGGDAPSGTRKPPVEARQLAQLLARAAVIQDQLHEISISGGDTSAILLAQAVQDLAEIRAALLKLMGRKP